MRFRLIKPTWARPKLRDGKPNPDFVRAIAGPDVIEGTWEEDFLKKRNEEGFHIYYFPNHPKKVSKYKPFISGKDVDVFKWVFCDYDQKTMKYPDCNGFIAEVMKFPVKPTKVINSGNGVHVYWKIKDLDRDTYIYTQLALIQQFGTDESVWTPLQLMRYPNTFNTKDPKNFKPVRVLEEYGCGKEYSIGDLAQHLPTLSPENQKKMTEHIDKLEGRKSVDLEVGDVDLDELPAKFSKLLKKNRRAKDLFFSPTTAFGDRSGADMSLANILYEERFTREEAFQVIYNGMKAKERSPGGRTSYAFNLIDRVYSTRPNMAASSVADIESGGVVEKSGAPVKGPYYFDATIRKWRKSEVLGIIAGPGVGKTSVSLDIVNSIIEQNPENDDIAVFFTIEMPPGDIIERWNNVIGDEKHKSQRLYLVSSRDENGDPVPIGLQEIYERCIDTINKTGKKISTVVIDHVSIMSKVVDLHKTPTFGAENSTLGGTGKKRVIDPTILCQGLKTLARMLNCFLIVQSQTTKARACQGDVPLGVDAAYGAAAFEWYCDYIITCWQPLRRVYDATELRVLGWQYAKVREQKSKDQVAIFVKYLLGYDQDTGRFRIMSEAECEEVRTLISQCNELRKSAEKKQDQGYSNSPRKSVGLKLAISKPEESE